MAYCHTAFCLLACASFTRSFYILSSCSLLVWAGWWLEHVLLSPYSLPPPPFHLACFSQLGFGLHYIITEWTNNYLDRTVSLISFLLLFLAPHFLLLPGSPLYITWAETWSNSFRCVIFDKAWFNWFVPEEYKFHEDMNSVCFSLLCLD